MKLKICKMKNIALYLVCVLFLGSCASTKKAIHETSTTDKVEQTAEKVESSTERLIDTTKTETGRITITEIEFFPVDNDARVTDTARYNPANVGELNVPNVKVKGGAIKSIKQTTIENEKQQKGESRENEESKVEKQSNVAEKVEQTNDLQQEPAPDPYRWRYIFYILLIGVGVFLYLKRQPVVDWLKKVISIVRRNL